MFTVFLLVVLATTGVSFTLDRASDGGNAVAKKSDVTARFNWRCCLIPACRRNHKKFCG
uniref:Rho-conotoxin TIA n=1 Tax=Conus tulipa TaxID=6495 RepID=CA1A_CONTU|nr:RecName: Full=Rho-conotoxin TIA; Short=Rho-TIA; Flags: Precursor [Conus tulipa]